MFIKERFFLRMQVYMQNHPVQTSGQAEKLITRMTIRLTSSWFWRAEAAAFF